MSLRAGRIAVAVLAFTLLLAGTELGQASSHGIDGYARVGCTCHGSTADDGVNVSIEGIPSRYVPGETYELTIRLTGGPAINPAGHRGGFNLAVEGGELKVPLGSQSIEITKKGEDRHWMGDERLPRTWSATGEAVQSHQGANARSWSVLWEAPGPGEGRIEFAVAGNSVDGEDHDTDGDAWSTALYASAEGDRSFMQWLLQNVGWIVWGVGGVAVIALFLGARRSNHSADDTHRPSTGSKRWTEGKAPQSRGSHATRGPVDSREPAEGAASAEGAAKRTKDHTERSGGRSNTRGASSASRSRAQRRGRR